MKKRRVLWISPAPPLNNSKTAGEKTYNYYVHRLLESGAYEFKFISLCDNERKKSVELQDRKLDITCICYEETQSIKKLSNIESKYSPVAHYCGLISNFCAKQIIRCCKKLKTEGYYPDVLILEWTATVVLTGEIKKLFPAARIIASEHDVVFVGIERKSTYYNTLFWKIRAKHEKTVELAALKKCDVVLVQNPDNAQLLVNEGIKRECIKWLCPYYDDMSFISRNPNKQDILVYGAMNRAENYLSAEWFIDHVMPLIEDLDIRFVVVGNKPPKTLLDRQNSRIIITGFVDDIIPFFENAICMVAPLVLGAGIKVKILEAMSSGIPVITNEIGIEGIPAKDREEYLRCDKPIEYAEKIREIVEGTVDLKLLHDRSKALIQNVFSLEKSVGQYMDLLNSF